MNPVGLSSPTPYEERRLTLSRFGWSGTMPHIFQPLPMGVRCRIVVSPVRVTVLGIDGSNIADLGCHPPGWETLNRTEFEGYVTLNDKFECWLTDVLGEGNQIERLMKLNKVPESSLFKKVSSYTFSSVEELNHLIRDRMFLLGGNGFILRHRLGAFKPGSTTYVMKFELRHQSVFPWNKIPYTVNTCLMDSATLKLLEEHPETPVRIGWHRLNAQGEPFHAIALGKEV